MAESEAPGNGLGKKSELVILEPASGSMLVPAMVAAAGERAAFRFIDFFTANIRNPNTRAAYAVAVRGFFAWLDQHGVDVALGLEASQADMGVQLVDGADRDEARIRGTGGTQIVGIQHHCDAGRTAIVVITRVAEVLMDVAHLQIGRQVAAVDGPRPAKRHHDDQQTDCCEQGTV